MATAGVLPIHSHANSIPWTLINSDSLLARRFWNNFGQGVMPAFLRILCIWVRKFVFGLQIRGLSRLAQVLAREACGN